MWKVTEDAYGHIIYDYYVSGSSYEIIEREDGYIGASFSGPALYFSKYEDWFEFEKHSIQHAHGRVLDIGCGAGRVGLYLQEKGLDVTGIDISSLALEVCRKRGLRNVLPASITQVNKDMGAFNTLVLFGNNFGLFASYKRARYLLKRFHRITAPDATIIAASNDIYQTDNPAHWDYQANNRRRGRMSGQIRLRVRYQQYKSPWFDYLMVSPQEMLEIIAETGWYLHNFIYEDDSGRYIAILRKFPITAPGSIQIVDG